MLDKQFIINKLKDQYNNRNIVTQLVLINVSLYLLGLLLNIFAYIFGYANFIDDLAKNWLYIPSQWQDFIYKPYTLLSYQFLHFGFFHTFSNMLIVYYFGNTFIQLTHKKKLLPLYLLGGFFAGGFYLLAYNFVPSLSSQSIYLVGASGSAMAILAAVATLIPNREVYLFGSFKVKYKWIALVFFGLNLLGLKAPNNAAAYAHIGGLVFGFIFIYASKEGYDLAKPVNDIVNYFFGFFTTNNQPKVTYVSDKFKEKKQFKSKIPNKETQTKIDAILDKISQNGYEKLTKAEKSFLFNNSNK